MNEKRTKIYLSNNFLINNLFKGYLISKHMAKIKLLGTSHVSPKSVEQVKRSIDELQPDIVCVELDKHRLDGMLSKEKQSKSPKLIFKIGAGGYIFLLFGSYVQKKIAQKLGMKPGQDMLTAVEYSKGRKVALIDQPAHITLKKMSKALTFFTMCKILFSTLFKSKKMAAELGIIDVSGVPPPDVIEKLLLYMKKDYPKIYHVLVEERNIYMVQRIKNLTKQFPEATLLVVVGAAHVQGMKELL